MGSYGSVDVSEEFKMKVINIAENDTDVQRLFANSYDVTAVRSIIKSIVDANGDVTTKATVAIVMLEKDTTYHASV